MECFPSERIFVLSEGSPNSIEKEVSSVRVIIRLLVTSLTKALLLTKIGTIYIQVCAFANHVQSIEFATGGLQSSCRNISSMVNGHLSSSLSGIAKGLNTYVNVIFHFNKCVYISKNLFSLCHYGVLFVD